MSKRAFLVGKGKSLDNATPDWFGTDEPIWCLNQATDVICKMLPKRNITCIQNDPWINYVPPANVRWYHGSQVKPHNHPNEEHYNAQTLTDNWKNPTCVCALQLLKNQGFDEIIMVGFDSHFDNSRDYAKAIVVKSDEIAPYHKYDSIMRRFARNNGMGLIWIDKDGKPHADDFKFTKCLVAVAMGEKYRKQTDGMIHSFLKHNPDWIAKRFYDADLESILPNQCESWTAFNKCEIGRWYAMQNCLDKYDVVLYSDGDIRWYGKYDEDPIHGMRLTHHYVTDMAKNHAKHWIMRDGAANIGIMEMSRHIDNDGIFDFIIGEVMHNPNGFKHKEKLWLQNIVSTLPDCGYDCVYNPHAGLNVAAWNLRHRDREVILQDGKYMVGTRDDELFPLISFHFSSNSFHTLDNYGTAVGKLKKEYLDEQ